MDSLALKGSVFEVARPHLAGFRRRRSVSLRVAAQAEPDLSVKVNGLEMPNPFVIGSGPPGTNYTVMKRAFDEGWGAVIAKTVQFYICYFCKASFIFIFLV
jgi:dihydropyrimidine dehydrogenase (NADP+)